MHHPEQPSLAGVVDTGVRRELAARGDADVRALADLRVDVVGLLRERLGARTVLSAAAGAGCPDIVPGRVGNACDFTAESRRLRVSYDPVFMPGARSGAPETLTVAFWVYFHDPAPEAFASSSAIGLPAGSGSANVWQSYLSTASDPALAGFISADDAEIRSLYAPEPILVERWIHLALVYDGGTKLLYFDGVEAARAEGETLRVSNQDVLIGADENDGSVLVFPLRGMLDEILLYDRALSPDEIRALASAG